MANILHEDYVLCSSCNVETHRDDMRGDRCKWCEPELNGADGRLGVSVGR